MNNLQVKQELSSKDLQLLSSEMDKRKKSPVVTWLLWLFLGGIGGHRYYLNKYGTAVLMTFTLGLFGIWALIDAFFIQGMIRKRNEEIESLILQEIKILNVPSESSM